MLKNALKGLSFLLVHFTYPTTVYNPLIFENFHRSISKWIFSHKTFFFYNVSITRNPYTNNSKVICSIFRMKWKRKAKVTELIDRLPVLCRCFRLRVYSVSNKTTFITTIYHIFSRFTFLNMNRNLQNWVRTKLVGLVVQEDEWISTYNSNLSYIFTFHLSQ